MICQKCDTRMVEEQIEICGCAGNDATYPEWHCPNCGWILGEEMEDD